ncbi:MAG: ArsR/SmtB family transcription factor [Actinomycetota bacterium]
MKYSREMDIFEALADPTRRHVIQLLGSRPRRAGELADEVGVSPSALSRHLKVLLEASIVEDERIPDDARVRVFSLRNESLASVQAYLDQLQAEWRDQLQSFKRHVEGEDR